MSVPARESTESPDSMGSINSFIDPGGKININALKDSADGFRALTDDDQAVVLNAFMSSFLNGDDSANTLLRSTFLTDAVLRHSRTLNKSIDSTIASAAKDQILKSAKHLRLNNATDYPETLNLSQFMEFQQAIGIKPYNIGPEPVLAANGTVLPSAHNTATKIDIKLAPDMIKISSGRPGLDGTLNRLAADKDLVDLYKSFTPEMAYRCQQYFRMWSEMTSKSQLLALQGIVLHHIQSVNASRFTRELMEEHVPREIRTCASGIVEAEERFKIYTKKWQGAEYLLAEHIYRAWSDCREFLQGRTSASEERRKHTEQFLKSEVAKLVSQGEIRGKLVAKRWDNVLKVWMAYKLSRFLKSQYNTTEQAMRHIQHCYDLGKKMTALVASLQLPKDRGCKGGGYLGVVLLIPDGHKVMLRDLNTTFMERFNAKLIDQCPHIVTVCQLVHGSFYTNFNLLNPNKRCSTENVPRMVGSKIQRDAWLKEMQLPAADMVSLLDGSDAMFVSEDEA